MLLTAKGVPQISQFGERAHDLPFCKKLFGQDRAFGSIKACLCCGRKMDMLLLGQEGMGKTTAAKLAFDEARKNERSGFSKTSPFVICDALMDENRFFECVDNAFGGALFLRNAQNLSNERAVKLFEMRRNCVIIAKCDKRNADLSSVLIKNCTRIDFEMLRVCDIKNVIKNEAELLCVNADEGALALIANSCHDAMSALRLLTFADNVSKLKECDVLDKAAVAEAIRLLRMETAVKAQCTQIGEALALGVSADKGCIIPVEAKFVPGDGAWINESAGTMARDAARSAYFAVNEFTGGAINGLKAVFNVKGGGNVDGPSIGLALTACLLSLIKGKVIKKGVAMTGEVSLSGDVLPVGGVDIKSSGASLCGVKNIWLPKLNAADAKGRGALVTSVDSVAQMFQMI